MNQVTQTQDFNGLVIPCEGPLSNKLLYALDAATRQKLIPEALNYYRIPGRWHHNHEHPMRMLNEHTANWQTDTTDALFLSILMHDAVYVPGESPMSEDMSRKLVPSVYYRVIGNRIPMSLQSDVYDFVHWTLPRFHVKDNHSSLYGIDSLQARLLDLDLLHMSDDWGDFVKTQEKIEYEFAHLGTQIEIKVGGARFLKSFVDKGFVYYTEPFKRRNEKALRNLKAVVHAILALRSYGWAWISQQDPDYFAREYDRYNS